jgi:intein/homing endonuclease
MTTEGAKQVKDLTAAPFTAVVNGKAYPAKAFWETGVKKVFRLRTKEGHTLRLTEDHKLLCVTKKTRQVEKTDWIPLKDIKEGMAIKLNDHRESHSWSGHGTFDEGWLLGLLIGDGTFANDYAKLSFWGEHRLVMLEKTVATLKANLQCSLTMKGSDNENKELASVISVELKKLAERYGIFPNDKLVTPKAEEASSEFYRGLLRGLFDTDGTIGGDQKKGVSVRLSQVKVELLYAVQRMLLRLGIASTVYKNRTEAGKRLLPDGKGGMALYHCEAMHELVIAKSNLKHFAEVVGFTKPDKKEKLEARLSGYARELNREPFAGVVESITEDGEEMVYDTTVDEVHCFDANGIVAHNCGEILLWSMQFCNLTIAVARAWDTPETLKEKVEIATIIGTIQSMATHFPGLRPKWKENCEEERLLGVDINGQMDCPVSRDPAVQRMLRDHAVEVNRIYAAKLGINQSAAITCVKPSGNSSVLLDCSPGLHARWAPYYIRNARVSASSSVYKVMRDVGVSMDPENGQTRDNATKWVVHFPTKSPDGAITRNDKTALEQCDYWLQCKQNYTEHNPSVTITYRPHEIFDIVLWVYRNQNVIGGMTFYPTDDARYEQPAYEEITRERYEELAAAFPQIDFAEIYRYEAEDHTTAAQELACAGGSCTREGN